MTSGLCAMMLRLFRRPLFLVVLLLLCQFALRTQHITVQQPYVDEGFHLRRAMVVWDFAENPGHFANGKVLVYYWMGLFEGPNTQLTILPVARWSIALFSMITGAAIYLLGKILANSRTGILALALYVGVPPAFFYERMAMADPLAAGLIALAVWRCYVFVRRPTLWQGLIIGLLLSLATLAKLTAIMIVLLPAGAILLYAPRKESTFIRHILSLIRRYTPGLIVAGLIGILLWLPMVIPAILARGTSEQFILVNDANISDATSEENYFQPVGYLLRLLPLLAEFLTPAFMAGSGLAALVGLILFRWIDRRLWRSVAYLLMWIGLITGPAFFLARLTTTRYFMPVAVPLVILLAIVIVRLIDGKNTQPDTKTTALSKPVTFSRYFFFFTLTLGLLLWLLTWVLPFAVTTLTAPHTLPFSPPRKDGFEGTNYAEYEAGYFLGDDAVQSAAHMLNMQPPHAVYITWNLCHLMFFYVNQPVNCLPEKTPRITMQNVIKALPEGESVYFVMADYSPFWDKIEGSSYEELGEYPRKLIKRPVYVLRMWKKQ